MCDDESYTDATTRHTWKQGSIDKDYYQCGTHKKQHPIHSRMSKKSLLNNMDKQYNKKRIIQTCTCLGITLLIFTGTTLMIYNMFVYIAVYHGSFISRKGGCRLFFLGLILGFSSFTLLLVTTGLSSSFAGSILGFR